MSVEIKNAVNKYFTKTCKAFKEFIKFKHLLFTTGLEDDPTFDMNSDATFSLDPNIGEFTVDAFRMGMIMYVYHFPDVNFNYELLHNEINANIFTFANNKFHPKFIENVKLHMVLGTDFVISFLPRINSSHWYTLCVQPSKNRIVYINPMKSTSNDDEKFLYLMSYSLFEEINHTMEILIENAGIQTSCMSCGENSLLISLAILTNGEKGYSCLINHLRNDHIINSLLDVHDIALEKKCFCCNCVNAEYKTFKKYVKVYKYCAICGSTHGRGIGLNDEDAEKCIFCGLVFDDANSSIIRNEKSFNKHYSEINIRKEIIELVDSENLDSIKKGCNTSEKLKLLEAKYAKLETDYEILKHITMSKTSKKNS